jgi:hypothetical protein
MIMLDKIEEEAYTTLGGSVSARAPRTAWASARPPPPCGPRAAAAIGAPRRAAAAAL